MPCSTCPQQLRLVWLLGTYGTYLNTPAACVQIGYRTVFFWEYFGPLVIYPLFYFLPQLLYPGFK